MPTVTKAKLDILRNVDDGHVLSAANGHNHWRGSLEEPPKEADVIALVDKGYLGLVNGLGHAVSTGQLFYITDEGRELLAPEPEDEAEDGD